MATPPASFGNIAASSAYRLLCRPPMPTEISQTTIAPQPPRVVTDAPREVRRKVGLAIATTNPSYQLIALSSSRSSTCADATSEPPFVEVFGDLID